MRIGNLCGVALAVVCMIGVSSACATTIGVTNGDFEKQDGKSGAVTDWYESSATTNDGANEYYQDWLYKDTSTGWFGSNTTEVFGMSDQNGWIYQQIGTYTPGMQVQVSPLSPLPPFVGRITGMVDCRWADEATAVPGPVAVPLGRKYALSAGLLEITYDAGARVLLQGPCTYEVDSRVGGFLSAGKLTARVEHKVESRESRIESTGEQPPNPKSQIPNQQNSNPQSLIPNPLFAIRTPTATVTDLGTEFGVEVNEAGNTWANVFQGMVEVLPIVRGARHVHAVQLIENEAVRVEQVAVDQSPVVRRTTDESSFVRVGELPKLAADFKLKAFRRWQAYSQELRRDPSLVAYYDFQQRPGMPSVLPNVAANADRTLDGVVEGAVWTNGRMPGKHALRFNSIDDRVQIAAPGEHDDLTVAAWVYVERFHDLCNGLLMSDAQSHGGLHWQLRTDGALGVGVEGGDVHFYQTQPAFDRQHICRWRHVATVYDHLAARVKLYVDGQVTDEMPIGTHVPVCIGAAWIGHWNSGQFSNPDWVRNLNGKIDELAIFSRPLKTEEIERMFAEGCAATGEAATVTKSAGSDQPRGHDPDKR